MAPKAKPAAEAPAKKTKSGGGLKKKPTLYNKFMKAELARLKEKHPDLEHKERFKQAAQNWKTSSENPKK